MAEFGAQATQLSAPTGAGATVVQPNRINVGTAVVDAVSSIGSIFQGLAKKDEADKLKQITSEYTRNLVSINNGLASGGLSPSEASVRQQDVYSQFVAKNPELYEELAKITEKVSGGSRLGQAQRQVQKEQDIRFSTLQSAANEGYLIPDTPAGQDKIIAARAARQQVEMAWESQAKRDREDREKGRWNNDVKDRERKELATDTLNMVGTANLDAFGAEMEGLISQVQNGKVKWEDAQFTRSKRFSQILSQVQAASQANPELANSYRTLFNEINETSNKLLDPKTRSEANVSEFNNVMAKAKLLAVKDVENLSAAVANSLYPNTTEALIASTGAARRTLLTLRGTPYTGSESMPPVVGTPQEKEIFKVTLKDLQETLKSGKPEAIKDAVNSVNHILTDVGSSIGKPGFMTPAKLQETAAFVASPEFGRAVMSKNVNQAALDAAARVIQISYQQPVAQEIDKSLADLAAKVGDKFKITSGTAGVKLNIKTDLTQSPIQQDKQRYELVTMEKALNQLIHMSAHYEGNQDYAKTWDKIKSEILPSIYPPEAAKAATVPGFKNEVEMKDSVKLTAAEQAKGDAYDLTDSNIRELQAEIAGTTKPRVKALLQAELERLNGKKGK